jgi:hypothetical protein
MAALCGQWCTGLILVMDVLIGWNDFAQFVPWYGITFVVGLIVAIRRRIWWAVGLQLAGLAIVLPAVVRKYQIEQPGSFF